MRLLSIITLSLFMFQSAWAQDECATAIEITDVTNWCSAAGAYTNASASASAFAKPACWSNNNNDVWFKFTAVAPAVSVTINGNVGGAGTLNTPEVALYEGDCAAGITEIQCESKLGSNTTSLYKGTLVIGDTYYIRVDGYSSSKGTFQLCIDNFFPPTLPGQDCDTRSHLCDKNDTITFVNLTGAGADARESAGTCMGASTPTGPIEANTAWFTWISDGNGTLAFDIVPTDPGDDIDFVVYEMPNKSCSDITATNSIRCMASGGGTCYGPTGLDFASTDLIENLDCTPGDDNYVRYLDMTDGTMYGLLINNFSSSGNGFTLTFSGTGEFKGPTAGMTKVAGGDSACVDNNSFTFQDNSVSPGGGAISQHFFDFGKDASPPTASGPGPHTVSYSSPGQKYVLLTIQSDAGCLEYALDTVTVLPLPELSAIITDVTCNNETTGAIDLSTNLGVTPLSYNWSNGATTEDLTNVGAGTYTITVTDDFGCASDTSFTIEEPTAIEDDPSIENDECGQGIGSITPNISGGTTPYLFNWDDGPTTENRTGLTEDTYTLTVTDSNNCTEVFAYTITNTEQPIADPGLGGETCGNSFALNANLSVTGSTGEWKTNSPGVSFAPNANDPNATVSSSTPQFVNLTWVETNNMCVDSASIQIEFKPTPTPDAGPDVEVCGLSTNHQAALSIYPGTWSDDQAPGTITYSSLTDPNATVTAPASLSGVPVTFYWTEDNAGCTATDEVILTFYDLPAPDAGPGGEVCDLCFDLNAVPSTGSGQWTAEHLDGSPASVTFTPNDTDENVQACVPSYDSIIFRWTVDLGVCNSSDTNLVIFRETPIADAGTDDTTCVLSYTLNATPSVGIGTWTSNPAGASFAPNANDPSATATVAGFGDVQFIWTEQNGICSDQDTVDIHFLFTPGIEAGNNQSVCSDSTQLAGSQPGAGGNGQWSSNNPGAITFLGNTSDSVLSVRSSQYGTITFYWTITYPACTLVDSVDVEFVEQPIAFAGNNDSICGTTHTLGAVYSVSSAPNNGQWTSSDGSDTFSDPNDNNATVTITNYGWHEFLWTEQNGACQDTQSVRVFFSEIPVADAGADDAICGQDYTLNASPSVGTGTWTDDSGVTLSYFPSVNDPNASVNVAAFGYGSINFTWTEDNNGCTSSDVVNINFVEQPNTFAGTDDSICGNSINLAAQAPIGTGTWSILSGGAGTFSNANSPNSSFDIVFAGNTATYELIWTDDNGFGCVDQDTVQVLLVQQPVANPGTDDAVCGQTYNLNASPSVGSGTWTDNSGTTLTYTPGANDPNASVDVSAFGYGTIQFTWTESNHFGFCVDSAPVNITFYETPVAEAGNPDTTCGQSIPLSASPSVGVGTWTSDAPGASFSPNANDPNATAQVNSYGTFLFVWTESNGSGLCTDQDSVYMTFYQAASAEAGNPDTICGLSNGLGADNPIGMGTWTSNDPGVNFADPNDPNTVATVPFYGDYVFYWNDTNGICTSTDSVNFQFYQNPIASFGLSNDTVYSTDNRVYFYDSSTYATNWDWNFGDGGTSNAVNPWHNYTKLGSYWVTLTVTDDFGCVGDTIARIWFLDNKAVYLPNAFSPNDDGVNDEFKISIIGTRPSSFEMIIFDRWGKMVFKTNDMNEAWNGTENNSGKPAPMGTYTAVVKYVDYGDLEFLERTEVFLIR